MLVCKIESSEMYDWGKFKMGGFSDFWLGIIDWYIKCEICVGSMVECFGYFGYLEFVKFMFYIGFLKIVLFILWCVCYNCLWVFVDEVGYYFFLVFWILLLVYIFLKYFFFIIVLEFGYVKVRFVLLVCKSIFFDCVGRLLF